jgi:hypothetical protein
MIAKGLQTGDQRKTIPSKVRIVQSILSPYCFDHVVAENLENLHIEIAPKKHLPILIFTIH